MFARGCKYSIDSFCYVCKKSQKHFKQPHLRKSISTISKCQLPTSNGLVENKPVVVLRDTVCSGVKVKRDLVKEEQLTGKVGYVMTVKRTLLKSTFCKSKSKHDLFQWNSRHFVPKNPLYELINRNILGARATDN